MMPRKSLRRHCPGCGKEPPPHYRYCDACRPRPHINRGIRKMRGDRKPVVVFCNDDPTDPDIISKYIFQCDLDHGHYAPGTRVIRNGREGWVRGETGTKQTVTA